MNLEKPEYAVGGRFRGPAGRTGCGRRVADVEMRPGLSAALRPHVAKAVLLGLAWGALPAAAPAGSLALEAFRRGNAAYEAGEFQKAREHYAAAINEGAADAALFYNYANALFRTQELGEAIRYYEKTLKLRPGDEDARANLRFANAQTVDKHPEPEQNALTRFLWYAHSSYPLSGALWVLLALFTGVFSILAMALYWPALRVLLWGLALLLALPLPVLGPSAILRIRELETARYAIVLTESVDIYSGPGEHYQVLSKVHEGTKFRIVESTGEWAKVVLPNGNGGYVPEAGLGKI